MATSLPRSFSERLQSFERGGDIEPLLSLFGEDATLTSASRTEVYRGRKEARQFWEQYRGVFRTIESTFINLIEGEKSACLEWTSKGALRNGEPLEYQGVTILETDGRAITALRTYFDSSVFLNEGQQRKPPFDMRSARQ